MSYDGYDYEEPNSNKLDPNQLVSAYTKMDGTIVRLDTPITREEAYRRRAASAAQTKQTATAPTPAPTPTPTTTNTGSGRQATAPYSGGNPTSGGYDGYADAPAYSTPTAPAPTSNNQTSNSSGSLGGNQSGNETMVDEATKEQLKQVASGNVGNVPGENLKAIPTDLTGTLTSESQVEQIDPVTPVDAPTEILQEQIEQTVANATQAQTPEEISAEIIENVSTVAEQDSTQAAVGEVSDGTQAELDFTPSEGTQAESVEVDTTGDGLTVEAVTGEMTPEAMAEAAQVAGVNTGRVLQAKKQLRSAGLSEEEISSFANDPELLEERLLDFTEEQRGMIAGLPVEALVSTQMEGLLEGLDSGNIPSWARPAVASVENMLTRRGMSASTVGRDALFNSIISAALPLAQQNAQSITQSALQQQQLQTQVAITNAELKQQATLQNAQNAFNLNLANMSNEQQARIANSQFFQTVAIQNATNKQQAAIQNAVNQTNLDVNTLEWEARLAAENAQAFLQMDLANLSNEQQAIIVDTQFDQQRLLSNAAAENAAKQFNAQSENQTRQFMASLKSNMDQFNTQQLNAMSTFNATEANKIAAQNANNDIAVAEFNAQLLAEVDKFNSTQELAREQWNASNRQAIEQSNVQWRRQANTADTAAQNAINQQGVQNAFQLTSQAQAALWQELRDAATFDFQGYENEQNRKAQLYATAIGNESAAANGYSQSQNLVQLAADFFS